jgi:hypothetical protein
MGFNAPLEFLTGFTVLEHSEASVESALKLTNEF